MKKIEITQEVAGMKVGTIKSVPKKVADNLISRELAKEVKAKETAKKATKE